MWGRGRPHDSRRDAGTTAHLSRHCRFVMGLQALQALIDLVPIHHIPPGLQVFRAAIVVLQVVGMLPDIITHDPEQTLRNGIVLIRGCRDLELIAAWLSHQPNPSTAKYFCSGVVELGLEV